MARWIDTKELDAFSRPPRKEASRTATDYRAIAEREYGDLQALLRNTPRARNLKAAGQAEDAPDDDNSRPEERLQETVGDRAMRLGTAFHAAMERVDLLSGNNRSRAARELSAQYGLDPENARKLEDMIRISLSSGLMERVREAVRSGRRVLRELPFVRSVGRATIEEGKVDLLFEEEGGWVLVDYKTDWVSQNKDESGQFFRNKYAGQIREYVEALQELSIKVASACLLLARTGDAIELPIQKSY